MRTKNFRVIEIRYASININESVIISLLWLPHNYFPDYDLIRFYYAEAVSGVVFLVMTFLLG